MRKLCAMTLVVVLSGVCSGAESEKGQSSSSSSNRNTWVVKAVRKTRDSIVTLKITKKSSRKETIGTGVIVDERGYIVTNRHVINGGVEIKAVLSDNSSYTAELDFEDGASATVVHSAREGRAVLLTDDMPAPPPGKTFELWLQDGAGAMHPAGLMDTPGDNKVLLDGDASAATGVGITVEPDGGSEEPTSDPIALFDLSEADA